MEAKKLAKKLMSGIAVVIDDAFKEDSSTETKDKIFQLVKDLEEQWEIPFYKSDEIPSDSICVNLLQASSFILLDWKLWPGGTASLEKGGIEDNIKFLQKAKDYFIPVFIFTNEDPAVIKDELSSKNLYDQENIDKNFIFIERKTSLTDNSIFDSISSWIIQSASVYTLKHWEWAFYKAKRELFSSMYEKSPSWPKVFWSSYKQDGVDPSSSFIDLINNNMLARMETDIFEKSVLDGSPCEIEDKDLLRSVLEGASFIPDDRLSENDIKAGDMFKGPRQRYLINIRANCDCTAREGQSIDDVVLYCIKGKKMKKKEEQKSYNKTIGNFEERVWENIVSMVDNGETIRFDFRKLCQKKYSDIKAKRVGRLIHPYITRIQQRYALYLQRQGLPRIPEKAII